VAFGTPLAAGAELADNTITWAGCGITKKAFMAELAVEFTRKTGIQVNLEGGGATRGIRDAVARRVDMGGACRMALPMVDRTEMYADMTPVAWDALAIIVHPDNPVTDLTTDQVKALYLGRISNWKSLGGADEPVKLYVREGKHSGVGYAIRQYLFQDSNVEFVSDYVVKSSGPLEKAVEQDPFAIAITGVSSARKRAVKIIGFDGREPSYENVQNGSYGMYRPLYLVTGSRPTAEVRSFIAFAQSADGRQIMRDNGTVPYTDAPQLMKKMLVYGFGVR
jgi:phosphate transport system substrate-binding protein